MPDAIIKIYSLHSMRGLVFITRHLQREKQSASSSRLLSLSVCAVAISLLVMLVSISIILGFKQRVSAYAYSQTGHISLYPAGSSWLTTNDVMSFPPEVKSYLSEQAEVDKVVPLLQQTAMLKTEDNFSSLMLYGFEEGELPPFFEQSAESLRPDESKGGNPIILPKAYAEKMSLSVGDKVRLYFMGDKIRVRSFYLASVYESGGLENMPALCSADVLRRLSGAGEYEHNRVMISLKPNINADEMVSSLILRLNTQSEVELEACMISTAEELLPELFSWLTLLDSNVVFLFVVMLLVGAFTMITSVIIIVLEKTRQIGLLKALGASNGYVQRIFALLALRQAFVGFCLGNGVAYLLLFLQAKYSIIKLNPKDYFMDTVPVVFDYFSFALINLGAFVLIALAILLPVRFVNSISPARVLRFD